jgi:hypothetical protein
MFGIGPLLTNDMEAQIVDNSIAHTNQNFIGCSIIISNVMANLDRSVVVHLIALEHYCESDVWLFLPFDLRKRAIALEIPGLVTQDGEGAWVFFRAVLMSLLNRTLAYIL